MTTAADIVSEPLRLTELEGRSAGLRRIAHGYATSGNWRRVAERTFTVAREVLAALPRDAVRAAQGGGAPPLRMEVGTQVHADAASVALYVHYSSTGQVSRMVLDQLGFLKRSGFAVVFISMAARIPDEDWQAARRVCALVVQRVNFGRDFGAWHDVMPEVRRRWPAAREMMLVNDSVLGPIHPLEPVLEAMRTGGEGLFGLTESVQGGAHLQSYMLLARGTAASADLMRFVQRLHVSHSKWLLVQRGEIRLARWMRRRGHRVAALFGYGRLISAVLADPAERARLEASHAKLRDLERLPSDQAAALLYEWPLNPTHHLWHVLATRFRYPFLKTELILRNPGRLPGVVDWPDVVPPDSPCPMAELKAHLATMTPR